MTLQFTGTLKYRIRISIFGYDLYAGPWQSQSVNISAPVPAESTSINLPDGFSGAIAESGNGAEFEIQWEGLPLFSETVPLTGKLPISLQPIKGVILAGTATLGA